MTVRIAKQPVNIREKLSELERPIGLKGSELMRAETAQEARDFVSAGRRNLVINGDMRIDQRGTSFTPAVEFGYTLDRWITFLSQTGSFNVTQETTSPPDGFTHYLRVTSTAATSSITGRNLLCQMVEGFNLAPTKWGFSDAKPCKISFWVRSSLPGKHGFTINDTNQRPCFGKGYYINQANTWEYKEIFVPPATFGDFSLNTNGRGCWLFWDMGSASGYDVPVEGIWNDTQNDYSVSGTVDIIATNGATFDITGVQLEVGKNATEFEHRSYGEELALCQRYFHRMNTGRFVSGYKRHDAQCAWFYQSPVPMRVTPTPTLNTGGTFSNFQTNYSTTQTVPVVYDYSTITGNGVFGVNSTWSSTHTFIPAYEGFDILFSSEV
jgi:hypothetical protein